ERAQAARRAANVAGKEPLEFQKGLFVERDEIELGGAGQVSLAQAVIDRVPRKAGVVFLSGETFFLGGGNDLAVPDQAGGAVMVKRRNAEDVHGCRARNFASSCAAI